MRTTKSEDVRLYGLIPHFPKVSKVTLVKHSLIKRHFPKTSKLHKIFSKNTVKVSYSCMSNMASILSSHNLNVINPEREREGERERERKREREREREREVLT